MVIPAGKTVDIYRETEDYVVDLHLEDAVTIDLSSTFDSIVDNTPSTMLSMLGSVSGDLFGWGFSGAFKQTGLQIWKGTQPMSLSLALGLYMKTDAYTDVIIPTKKLMQLPLPGEPVNGVGLEAPGPSVLEAFGGDDGQTQSTTPGKQLSMRIGNIVHITRMLVKTAQPTFSEDVDSKGYPIWVKLKLEILTIYTATTKMVDDYFGV